MPSHAAAYSAHKKATATTADRLVTDGVTKYVFKDILVSLIMKDQQLYVVAGKWEGRVVSKEIIDDHWHVECEWLPRGTTLHGKLTPVTKTA
jgi:hypothetical protein